MYLSTGFTLNCNTGLLPAGRRVCCVLSVGQTEEVIELGGISSVNVGYSFKFVAVSCGFFHCNLINL